MTGDAYNLDYSGWISSGIQSSENCLNRFFPGPESQWKPADTSCCEVRQKVNATVDGDLYFNYNFRYNFIGCGEELWSPGASYLRHERFWPDFADWQSTAASTQCELPVNGQGEVDTNNCSVKQGDYRIPVNLVREASYAGRTRVPPAMRRTRRKQE